MMRKELEGAELSEEALARLTKSVMRRCREHLCHMTPLAGEYSSVGLEFITNVPVDDLRSECYPQFLQMYGLHGIVGERRAYGVDGRLVPGYYALYGPRGMREFLDQHEAELSAFIKAHQSGRIH